MTPTPMNVEVGVLFQIRQEDGREPWFTNTAFVTLDDALRYAEERVAQALAIDAEYRAGLERDLANEAWLAHQAFLRHQASTRPQPAADRTEWPRF